MSILWIILGLFALLILFLVVTSMNTTYSDHTEIRVDAPLDKAFKIFNDDQHMKEWLSTDKMQFERIEHISGGEREAGSKWKMFFKYGKKTVEMIETVTDFVENERFAFDIEDNFAKFHTDIRFRAENGQTVITETQNGAGKNLMAKIMLRMFGGQSRKIKKEMYARLKALIEREKANY